MFSEKNHYDNKHILLVEDEIVTAMVESNAITKSGFSLTHVFSGEDAVKYVSEGNRVDLILMGITMKKGISGIDAAQQILDIADIPLMFLSSHTEMNVIERTESITSYGYVLKDGNVFVMLAAIRMAIRLHAARNLYKVTYENSINGIVIHQMVENPDHVEPQFIFVEVNKSYELQTGVHRDTVLGKTIDEVFEYEGNIEIQRNYKEILMSGVPQSKRIYYQPLSKWFELNIFPLSKTRLTVVMHDITNDVANAEQARNSLENEIEIKDHLIKALCNMVEVRDPYTSGHQERVSEIAVLIAQELNLSSSTVQTVKRASLVHDIGKNSVPSEYLVKPSRLTQIEFELIKEHSEKGYTILKDVPFDAPIADIIHQHHERVDGSGYPNQLKGEDILIEAKIIAVSDVIEAMSSHRPYRAKLGLSVAVEEIKKNRGTLYDEKVVDAALALFHEGCFLDIL